jgi:uncharacterized protein YbjT (DUF2867 family)
MAHRILLTGASGVLGRELVRALQADGHDLVALSRRPRSGAGVAWKVGDLGTGAGLQEALEGVEVVVHAATHPFKTRQTDVEGLRRLIALAPGAWYVYPSIVGVDRIPFFYYRHKLAAERLLAESGVRHTIVRLTQFHEFADRFAQMPVAPVPKGMRVQAIAAADAADAVAEAIRAGRTGLLPDVGGPEVLDLAELVRQRKRQAGRRGPVLQVPFKGWREFQQGLNLCPERRVGRITWAEHAARGPPSA